MAATDEMVAIALETRPHACCLVPEQRSERTTEGGLDVVGGHDHLKNITAELLKAGVRVSLFIEPSLEAVRASRSIGAPVIELHTGAWCDALAHVKASAPRGNLRASRRRRRWQAARASNVTPATASIMPRRKLVSSLPQIVELNIGHFLIGEAVFAGLKEAITQMRAAMAEGRATAK